MARPRIQIDQKQFQDLCSMLCTLEEIADWFRCSEDTVERWCVRTYKMGFADTWKKYSARGKISIRRNQLKLSEKSAAMAIFLGKQYLGQRDMPIEVSATVSKIDEMTREIFQLQKEQREAELEEDAED